MSPKLLDLFCGAGGCSEGYARAGFEVVGLDIAPQPRYPFAFVRGDALNPPVRLEAFDVIHASPPCQGFTAYKRRPGHVAPRDNLIPAVRAMLEASGRPWIIENVPGSPLRAPVLLCGSMFGLDVRRHRWFETSPALLMSPSCAHGDQAPRFKQATNRKNARRTVEVGVWRIPLAVQQKAMGIDWMELEELSEAIPPAFTEWLGRRMLETLRAAACGSDRAPQLLADEGAVAPHERELAADRRCAEGRDRRDRGGAARAHVCEIVDRRRGALSSQSSLAPMRANTNQ